MSNSPVQGVIVTGSSRGIGRAIALRLARDGFAITVNYAGNQTAADAVVAEIVADGGQAIAVKADVSQPADVEALFDATEQAFGGVYGLVNNAGVLAVQPVAETDDATFERLFAINVRGTFNTLRAAAKRMGQGGRIINLSTSATPLRIPGYATYCATKAAVETYTAILSKELAGRAITVNAVAPGAVGTELFFEGKTQAQVDYLISVNPFKRLGEPEDIARVVAFLMSPEGEWINGQVVRANGGTA